MAQRWTCPKCSKELSVCPCCTPDNEWLLCCWDCGLTYEQDELIEMFLDSMRQYTRIYPSMLKYVETDAGGDNADQA